MELKIGEKYEVTAIQYLPYGVIFSMEDGTTELIHVSKLSDSYVTNIEETIELGTTYTAVGVKGTKRPIELSLKRSSKIAHAESSSKPSYVNKKSFSDNSSYEYYKPTNKPSKKRRTTKKKYYDYREEWY